MVTERKRVVRNVTMRRVEMNDMVINLMSPVESKP